MKLSYFLKPAFILVTSFCDLANPEKKAQPLPIILFITLAISHVRSASRRIIWWHPPFQHSSSPKQSQAPADRGGSLKRSRKEQKWKKKNITPAPQHQEYPFHPTARHPEQSTLLTLTTQLHHRNRRTPQNGPGKRQPRGGDRRRLRGRRIGRFLIAHPAE